MNREPIRRRDPFWPPALLALALLCVVVFVEAWRQSRRGGPAGPVGPVGATPPAGAPADLGPGRLTIEFLDVGQGDAALIRSPEGKLALVDAGPTAEGAARLLRERGIGQLDLAVVSHHHADHYGGMLAVVREFRPRAFLDAPSPHSSRAYAALLRAVRDSGAVALEPTPGAPRKVKLGSALLTILPRPPVDVHNENNNSIGLRVDYGDFSALLTGDSEVAERAYWREHAPDLCARATVLKLAHHGSRNGVDAAWLKLARPELAVASLGAGNDFGHPHAETLRRLDAARVPLDRTDRLGTIAVTTDGQAWAARAERADPAGAAAAGLPSPRAAPGTILAGPWPGICLRSRSDVEAMAPGGPGAVAVGGGG